MKAGDGITQNVSVLTRTEFMETIDIRVTNGFGLQMVARKLARTE